MSGQHRDGASYAHSGRKPGHDGSRVLPGRRARLERALQALTEGWIGRPHRDLDEAPRRVHAHEDRGRGNAVPRYAVVRGSWVSTGFAGWSSSWTIAIGAESPARKPIFKIRR